MFYSLQICFSNDPFCCNEAMLVYGICHRNAMPRHRRALYTKSELNLLRLTINISSLFFSFFSLKRTLFIEAFNFSSRDKSYILM